MNEWDYTIIFFDLGGHSLLALRMINEINKTLSVRLNVPDFFQHPTIEQLAATIERSGPARITARVVPLRQGNLGLPVYFMGARPDEYRLAQLISADRTVFLVEALMPAEWIDAVATEDRKTLPTMEQMGELYGRILFDHVGTAPCVIAGYSLGGKIAFEAAHALRRAGGNAAFVLLIDARAFTWSGARKIATAWRSFVMALRDIVFNTGTGVPFSKKLSGGLNNLWHFARWQIGAIPTAVNYYLQVVGHRRLAGVKDVAPAEEPSGYFDTAGRPVGMWVVYRLAKLVGQPWRPRPLDAMGALIRARSDVDMLPGYDRAHGWRTLFRQGFELVQSEGDHFTIVTYSYASFLSGQINTLLERYGTGQTSGMEAAVKTTASEAIAARGWGSIGRRCKAWVHENRDICVPEAEGA